MRLAHLAEAFHMLFNVHQLRRFLLLAYLRDGSLCFLNGVDASSAL
ncbi:hypothetical protein [Enterobacter hormaechei]|nr:hypothetical protein [Enterobacter hormaechei]